MWATFTVAFFGFLRASEFTVTTTDSSILQWSGIQLSTTNLLVLIRQSKTDPFRTGHVFHIVATGTSTCPIKAVIQYSEMLPNHDCSGPIFSTGQFSPLTHTLVTITTRHLLQQAGLHSTSYSSHSFESGQP